MGVKEEGVAGFDPFSQPFSSRALGHCQTPKDTHPNLWLCPKEKTVPLWGVIGAQNLLMALAGIGINGFSAGGLSHDGKPMRFCHLEMSEETLGHCGKARASLLDFLSSSFIASPMMILVGLLYII